MYLIYWVSLALQPLQLETLLNFHKQIITVQLTSLDFSFSWESITLQHYWAEKSWLTVGLRYNKLPSTPKYWFTKFGTHSFTYTVANILNSLPNDLRTIQIFLNKILPFSNLHAFSDPHQRRGTWWCFTWKIWCCVDQFYHTWVNMHVFRCTKISLWQA